MNRYVVWVEFGVRPEARIHFDRLVRANAARSLVAEPGCHRFDVLTSHEDGGPDFALYECYASQAAFDAHLASDHYASFAEAVSSMVTDKRVSCFVLE